jgi:hypothetical protein
MSIYYHDNFPYFLVGGFNPSEKYEFASWDDDISNRWNKNHVPNHQPAMFIIIFSNELLYANLCQSGVHPVSGQIHVYKYE